MSCSIGTIAERTLSGRRKVIVIILLHSEEKSIRLDKNDGGTIYLLNNHFLHQAEQVFSVGWDNAMHLVFVRKLCLMDMYNEEPELFD